tara:strand:+ start:1102 stop:1308 length:207 start_codon:yes stop_codon:yes gene_type:complete
MEMTQTQMFNESEQTWADVVRYGISTPTPEQDTDDYTDDYVYDSDIEDIPDEPNDWDPGNLLPPDEEW